ncbi:MAG: hypothetical protein AAF491_00575, partial [Verrucomicrobiota bacterium]
NPEGKSGLPWCLAKEGECYLLFVPAGVETPDVPIDGPRMIIDPETGEKIEDATEKERVILVR